MEMKKKTTEMRRFRLVRNEDESGVSGTGVVAEGVEFANGKCCLTWLSQFTSVTIFDSMKVLEEIHSHKGKTKVDFYD
jgi:hypothetical protein